MLKKIFIFSLLYFGLNAQTIDAIGMSSGSYASGSYSFLVGDTVFVRLEYSGNTNPPSNLLTAQVGFYTGADGSTGGPFQADGTTSGYQNFTDIDLVVNNSASPRFIEFKFLIPSTVASNLNSFQVNLATRDAGYSEFIVPPVASSTTTAPTSYQNHGDITHPPTIDAIGLRSEDESDDTSYGSLLAAGDSVHVGFTVSAGTVPASAFHVRLMQLDGSNNVLANTDASTVTIRQAGAGQYRVAILAPSTLHSSLVNFVARIQLNSGEDYFYTDAVAVSDQPAGYVDVSNVPTYTYSSSSDWFTQVTPDVITVTELGVRDFDDLNDFITTTTDSLQIEFRVSAGTVPSTAYRVRVYQVNSSNAELVNQQFTDVEITNNGGRYEMTIANPFTGEFSFNASLDHFLVTLQLEASGETYASSTLSSESFTELNTAENTPLFYISLNDGTPAVTELGIRAATTLDQELNVNEQVNLYFTVDANDEVPSSSDVTIYEFNGNSSVNSYVREDISISGTGTGPYTMNLTGIPVFSSGADSIAVLLNLDNTPQDFVSKDEITGTYINDNTVTSSGVTLYSALLRTNNPPTANNTVSFRYGAPSDNTLYFTWNHDVTLGDASLREYRLVYDTDGTVADNDTMGTGFVTLAVGAQENYALTVASPSVGMRLFVIDNNNEISSVEFGQNLDFGEGLTYTLSPTVSFTAPNIPAGNSTNNELLVFDVDRSGTVTATDRAIVSSITITTADSNDNVSSSILSNFELYLDNGSSDNEWDGSDQLLNTVSQNWNDGTVQINLNQNNILTDASYRMLLIADANNATAQMKISVSIASSNYALSNDGSLSGANTAVLAGSVGPQGADGDGDITLPVSLIEGSFVANKLRSGIELTAETAVEENVKYIRYERSTVNKSIAQLSESDWEDTGLKIESSSEYISQGRELPAVVDKVSYAGKSVLRYRLITEELDGSFKKKYADNKNIIEVDPSLLVATEYELHQNFPNPFNPSTNISFDVPFRSLVTLEIYNILGQRVRTLFANKALDAQMNHVYSWNGLSDSGERVASGVYFYRLTSKDGGFTQSRKMMLVK